MQVACIGVEDRGLPSKCRDHVRVAVADVADVVDAIEEGAAGVVIEVGTAPAHDLELLPVADRQRRAEHLGPPLQQHVRRCPVFQEALGRKAQDEVRVGRNGTPYRPQRGLADTWELA